MKHRSDSLERRHAVVLGRLDPVVPPTTLRSRAFLESIYERATNDAERALAADVASELRRPVPAPSAPELELESAPLRGLPRTKAPGLLKPRVVAEIKTWRDQWRRSRRRHNVVRLTAAAVVLLTGIWTLRTLTDEGRLPADIEGDDIVIVRYEVSRPFAPGFSRNAILRQFSGGSDGR